MTKRRAHIYKCMNAPEIIVFLFNCSIRVFQPFILKKFVVFVDLCEVELFPYLIVYLIYQVQSLSVVESVHSRTNKNYLHRKKVFKYCNDIQVAQYTWIL